LWKSGEISPKVFHTLWKAKKRSFPQKCEKRRKIWGFSKKTVEKPVGNVENFEVSHRYFLVENLLSPQKRWKTVYEKNY
jgi:hypothetical protein